MATLLVFLLHLLASIAVIGFVVNLPRVNIPFRRNVIWGMVGLSFLLITLSYIASLEYYDENQPLMFVGFCLTPMLMVVLGISAFYRLSTPSTDLTVSKWAIPSIVAGYFLLISPSIGYFAPGAACNAIHRAQLEPVREALLAYQKDSARFPLGIQALQPFYLEEKPKLLCFGTDTRYHLISCEQAVMLEMDDFYGENAHRLFIVSGDWETANDKFRTCEPVG